MEESQSQLTEYYKGMYEQELKKNEELTEKIVSLEALNADLNYKLDKVRKSKLWKATYPARLLWSHTKNLFTRIKSYGTLKNILAKIKSKQIERKAYKSYGTLSMPSEQERKEQSGYNFGRDIKFSILVPLYNTSEHYLREMIDSVLDQTYGNFELCLADGSDSDHSYVGDICLEYAGKDKRIRYKKLEKNEGISGNTNECRKMATGDYIGLFDHDDILHPCALFEYMKVICEKDADYIYCDEATFKDGGEKRSNAVKFAAIDNMVTLHFKPDFAIDNLRANNYICHFSVFSKDLIGEAGLFRSQYDGSQDHDMILRLTAKAKNIVHVPKILYYWRSHAGSVASDINAKTYAIDSAKRAVAAHLKSCGFRDFRIESSRAFQTIFRIRYRLLEKPLVSIIIPNRDHLTDLKRCIDSILEKTSYENYELIIVENNSKDPELFDYYTNLKKLPNVKVVYYEGEFNYSRINNLGEHEASGKYLVLLNNDTEIVTRNWLEELLMYAQREDVGAVGCMLYYEDYSIQHAGIVLGLGAHRTAGHSHYRLPKDNLGYMGRLCYAQNVSAVTGACLMTKRALYEEVGGLNEDLAVALNDVDFCLKLREKRLLNVFTPYAELFHYESRSRGSDVTGSDDKALANAERYNRECEYFKKKWKKVLEKGDPYFNPNFSLDYSNFVLKGSPKGMLD
ncbi:MAG: glycosyltransferase family 2 protein [Lachnospiraceae bacterium]|nr:glycosyltransferase family 2 protein [Lachnospiraceae bacterium]